MKILDVIDLMEARTNPEVNVKNIVSQYVKQKYGNRPNIFLSFSSTNKVGIHPSSSYNTPNGVYCYPLEYLMKLPYWNLRPFPMFSAKYCMVVEITDSSRVFDVKDQLPLDIIQKAKELGLLEPSSKRSTLKTVWKNVYNKIFEKYGRRPGHTDDDSNNDEPSRLARDGLVYFRKLGIDGVTDLSGTKTIHENEPVQAVFFNMRCITHLETLENESDENVIINDELIPKIQRIFSDDDIKNFANDYNKVIVRHPQDYDEKEIKKILPDSKNVIELSKSKMGSKVRSAVIERILYISSTIEDALSKVELLLSLVDDGEVMYIWRRAVFPTLKMDKIIDKWVNDYEESDITKLPTKRAATTTLKMNIVERIAMAKKSKNPKYKSTNENPPITVNGMTLSNSFIEAMKSKYGEKKFSKALKDFIEEETKEEKK